MHAEMQSTLVGFCFILSILPISGSINNRNWNQFKLYDRLEIGAKHDVIFEFLFKIYIDSIYTWFECFNTKNPIHNNQNIEMHRAGEWYMFAQCTHSHSHAYHCHQFLIKYFPSISQTTDITKEIKYHEIFCVRYAHCTINETFCRFNERMFNQCAHQNRMQCAKSRGQSDKNAHHHSVSSLKYY